MFAGKKVMVAVAVFVFVLGFSLAVQAYASQAQQSSNPATQYLRENYGVDSVEQLIAKYRLEIQQNLSRQLQQLKSEIPDIPDIEMSRLNIPYWFGTSTKLPSVEMPTFESAAFSQPAMAPTPIVALQYFGFSGLCLVGLMAVPAVRKRKWLKLALAVCIIALAAFSAGYLVGTITAQTGTITIEPASFTETASYVIFGEDTDNDGVLDIIYAKNGRTGQIEFSGPDAATVILTTINALSTTDGKILVKNGDYLLTQTILLQNISNVVLSAESWKTRLITTGEESAIALGHKSNSDYACANITIEGFYIDCSSQTTATTPPQDFSEHEGCGIEVGQSCDNIVIRNNFIYNSGSDSIFTCRSKKVLIANNWIESTRGYYASIHHHGYIDESTRHRTIIVGNIIQNSQVGAIRHGSIIANNFIRNCPSLDYYAIYGADLGTTITGNYLYNVGLGIYSWGQPVSIAGNVLYGTGETNSVGISLAYTVGEGYTTVESNSLANFDRGISFRTGIKNVIIKGNIIKDAIYSGIFGSPENSIIEGNIIKNVTGYDGMMLGGTNNLIKNNFFDTISRYGIQEYGSADYNVIEGNVFVNVTSTPIVKVGANTIIRNNIGYVTENSGTATFSGDGTTNDFSIGAHGLAVTDPNRIVVKVSPISSDAIAASPCVGYVDPADNTKIRVKFASPPASGTDNVKIIWEAEVVP